MSLHDLAGRGFARASDSYERGRPGYPEAAVAWLLERAGVGPGTRVLDVGAGTGKLTRLLVPSGAALAALEPVAEMRALLCQSLPTVALVAGTAEAVDAPAGSCDVVTVAQAFHWLDGPRALAELHRVLVPAGRLALVWNERDEATPWIHALTVLFDRFAGDAPRFRTGAWRRAFEDTALFGPLEERSFAWTHLVDEAGLRARYASVSYVAALDPATRARALAEALDLARPHRDALGRYALRYATRVFVTVARP
ncbi:MAG: methyltransferase domain-containing protein [Myxococcales bacterium]|nr:methyltransferase domain-containing protein [Myxococcales bacterium]